MRRYFFITLFLFMVFSLIAQDGEDPLNVGGGVGSVIIGDEVYMRFRLNPELTLGKLGIGLDIDLLMDADGNIREEDWDDFEDYVNKLYYIRYGNRGDNFYGKLGSFNSYSLGHGLVMNDYCNTLNYPMERQLGLMLGIGLPIMDLQTEIFTSSVTNPSLLAGRVTFEPLSGFSFPIVKDIQLGATFGYDTDQYEGLSDDERDSIKLDSDGDSIWDEDDLDPDGDGKITQETYNYLINDLGFPAEWIDISSGFDNEEELDELTFDEDDVMVWAVDYEVPLVKTDLFKLSHYAEYSQIVDHNSGLIFPGFAAQIAMFELNLEYRMYEEDYIAGYFDHYYDQDRATTLFNSVTDNYDVTVKEDYIAGTEKSAGWFGKLHADIFDFMYMEAGYTDMYADDDEDDLKSLTGVAGINTKIIPKLKNMEFKYYQLDVPKIEKLIDDHVIIRGIVRLEISPGTNMLWDYQERYIDVNGDGEIEGEDETVRNISFGVEFQF